MRAYLVYGLYRFAALLARLIPSGLVDRVAGAAGRLSLLLSPRLRRALRQNMRHVLGPTAPESEIRRCSRGIAANLIRNYYDQFQMDRLTAEDIKRRGYIQGWEHVEAALAPGRGVIVVTAHFGNMDLLMQLPPVYGVPITGVVEHIQPEPLYRYALRQRTSHGLKLIPSDGPMLSLFRALKRGQMIGLVCDRVVTHNENAGKATLFGAPACLPAGPVQLALKTGAVILPGHALRMPDGLVQLKMELPVELERTGDEEADLAAGMARMAAILEGWIREQPDQWLITVPIWSEEHGRA